MEEPAMPEYWDRLDSFIGSIMNEAKSDASAILEELRSEQEKAVREMEDAISAEAARYQAAKIAEISARESRRVSAHMTENKLKLLEFRESCANEVYKEVAKKISEFVDSPEYPDYLVSLLNEALKAVGSCSSADVYLREEDMHLKEKLARSTGASLTFHAGAFSLGGLRVICKAQGRRVDASFDTALEELKGHFSELTGLQVDN
jgi:vacuolar-type H+-ATPase subunit E/Vma4